MEARHYCIFISSKYVLTFDAYNVDIDNIMAIRNFEKSSVQKRTDYQNYLKVLKMYVFVSLKLQRIQPVQDFH